MARPRSTPALVLFEDERASALAPLSLLHPVFDLKVGARSLRDKIETGLRRKAAAVLVRDYLRNPETGATPLTSTLLVNGRAICDPIFAALVKRLEPNSLLTCGDTLVAARVEGVEVHDEFPYSAIAKFSATECDVRLVNDPWDVVRYFPAELSSDLSAMSGHTVMRVPENISPDEFALRVGSKMSVSPQLLSTDAPKAPAGSHFLRPRHIKIGKHTRIHSTVVINAEAGLVVIGDDCTIMPFTYIEGPCYIGSGTIVKPHTSILHSSIGPVCRVSGEISATTMHSFVNKQHEGFVGDSYFAPWVNLGAGTITSNLKNTYGNVRVVRGGVQVETGLQFLGTIAADHTKFGINTMLNTGTIVGVGCNVYGAGFPAKEIPSFQWGNGGDVTALEKFVPVARSVMSRRGQSLTPHAEQVLAAVYASETRGTRGK